MVAPPGDRFVLHHCEAFAPLEPGDTGIAFVTDEIDKLATRMEKGKMRFTEPVTAEEWGKSGKFSDPDGNIFWLLGAPKKMVSDILKSRATAMQKRGTRQSTARKRF